MTEETSKTVVNSWNEWDPLKHVIVGVADGCMIPPPEPALECKVPIDSDMRGRWGPRPQETVDKANAQVFYVSAGSGSTVPRRLISANRFPPRTGKTSPCSGACRPGM